MTSIRVIHGVIAIIGILVSCSLDSPAQEAIDTSLTTDGTTPRPAYPAFSWDRIPLYMHMRKSAAFTPEGLEYLSN